MQNPTNNPDMITTQHPKINRPSAITQEDHEMPEHHSITAAVELTDQLQQELTHARAYIAGLENALQYRAKTAEQWADRALKSERDYGEALANAQRELVEATK